VSNIDRRPGLTADKYSTSTHDKHRRRGLTVDKCSMSVHNKQSVHIDGWQHKGSMSSFWRKWDFDTGDSIVRADVKSTNVVCPHNGTHERCIFAVFSKTVFVDIYLCAVSGLKLIKKLRKASFNCTIPESSCNISGFIIEVIFFGFWQKITRYKAGGPAITANLHVTNSVHIIVYTRGTKMHAVPYRYPACLYNLVFTPSTIKICILCIIGKKTDGLT